MMFLDKTKIATENTEVTEKSKPNAEVFSVTSVFSVAKLF
jgi:hypothetical protein